MNNHKAIEWVLRVAVAGEFLGHGILALQGKAQWIGWIQKMLATDAGMATRLLLFIGVLDVIIAIIVLFRPVRIALLWAAFWGFWTALVRPLMGESIWDFVERFANWGAPLSLLLLRGWPKGKEWFQ